MTVSVCLGVCRETVKMRIENGTRNRPIRDGTRTEFLTNIHGQSATDTLVPNRKL